MRGSATTTARHLAREMATLTLLQSRMNPRPREPYSPKLEQREKIQTGASCPWNLSTLPTRAKSGSAACKLAAYHDIHHRMVEWQQKHDPT